MNLIKRIQYRIQGRHWVDATKLKACGNGCLLTRDCYFMFPERIVLGDHVRVGEGAYWHGEGGIAVGSNTIFGPRTTIWTGNHDWKSDDCLPYGTNDILDPVSIGDNVWIGLGAMIAPGVTIGEGAIVAMGSVVVRDVAPLTVVGGNPATFIGQRDAEAYERAKVSGKVLLVERAKQQRRR